MMCMPLGLKLVLPLACMRRDHARGAIRPAQQTGRRRNSVSRCVVLAAIPGKSSTQTGFVAVTLEKANTCVIYGCTDYPRNGPRSRLTRTSIAIPSWEENNLRKLVIATCLLGMPLVSLAEPTPRRLVQKPIVPSSVVSLLTRLKELLASHSNVRADLPPFRTSATGRIEQVDARHDSDDYRITDIKNCTITLGHRSTGVDQNYDGTETTTTALVNLSNLRSDVKVSERGYGEDWEPPSRWVVSDIIVDGRTPIPTEIVRAAFPGLKQGGKSQSDSLVIEFPDSVAAEQARTLLVKAIAACSGDKKRP
jgi:hypothetical protein